MKVRWEVMKAVVKKKKKKQEEAAQAERVVKTNIG